MPNEVTSRAFAAQRKTQLDAEHPVYGTVAPKGSPQVVTWQSAKRVWDRGLR